MFTSSPHQHLHSWNLCYFRRTENRSSSNSDYFAIISDSLSAVKSISYLYTKNELVQRMQELTSTTDETFTLMWVPSHVGISGNETAVKFANEATLTRNAIRLNLTTSSELLYTVNHKILETWQKNWTNVPLSNKLRYIIKAFRQKMEHLPQLKNMRRYYINSN